MRREIRVGKRVFPLCQANVTNLRLCGEMNLPRVEWRNRFAKQAKRAAVSQTKLNRLTGRYVAVFRFARAAELHTNIRWDTRSVYFGYL